MTEFTMYELNGVAVLVARGRMIMGAGTSAVRDTVAYLIKHKRKQIVFDLKEVTYMDSCVLGELVSAQETIEKSGGEIKLVNSPRVKDILIISRLHGVFEVFDD